MMGLSLGHLIVVLVIVLVLFGAGRLPRMMGDLGRGIRNFKEGLNEVENEKKPEHKTDDPPRLPPQ